MLDPLSRAMQAFDDIHEQWRQRQFDDQYERKGERMKVYRDFDSDQYRCGGLTALVVQDEDGELGAEISFSSEYLLPMCVSEVQCLKSLCEALIERMTYGN